MNTVECPYCDADVEINHDDGFGYEEDVNHEIDCDCCGKTFIFQTGIIYVFTSAKADCLNDDNHKWKKSRTSPSAFTKMHCETCDAVRELTDSERKEFGIETVEEYFKKLES